MSKFFQVAATCNPKLVEKNKYDIERTFQEIQQQVQEASSAEVTKVEGEGPISEAAKDKQRSRRELDAFRDHLNEMKHRNLGRLKLRSKAHEVNMYDTNYGVKLPSHRMHERNTSISPSKMYPAGSTNHPIDKLHMALRQAILES